MIDSAAPGSTDPERLIEAVGSTTLHSAIFTLHTASAATGKSDAVARTVDGSGCGCGIFWYAGGAMVIHALGTKAEFGNHGQMARLCFTRKG